MTKNAMFTMKLEPELRDSFMAEAAASDRPASQLVREFMRDFVHRRRQAREHESWFRGEVEQGMREADDPAVARLPHDQVEERWRRRRAELMKRAGRKAG